MLNRSHACMAMILCAGIVFAEDTTTPSASSGNQAGGASTITPSQNTDIPLIPAQSGTTSTGGTAKPAASTSEGTGFSLPGGAGYAPLNFTPGQGRFDRKPLSFNTTIQQGYDDNVNSSSGKGGAAPVKGSLLTNASEGVDVLLSQSRMGLSFGANVGGQYYWENTSTKLTPNGGANVIFAYKITPRLQFSAVANTVYTTQPTLSVVNGLNQSNQKGYLVTNSKFDILYSWTPRFSTDTMYSNNSAWYQASTQKGSNYMNQTVGQSARYAFSPLVTGVIEGRYAYLSYHALPNGVSSPNDSNTYYALVGTDITLSRRLSASFRVGDTTRSYKTEGMSSSSSPYGEGSLNYTLTKYSLFAWDVRYGFEDGGTGSQTSKSVRTGISLVEVFTPRIRGSLGINYTHVNATNATVEQAASSAQDSASVSLGAQYAYTKTLSFFGNVNRMQNFSSNDLVKYSKDVFWLGATYTY